VDKYPKRIRLAVRREHQKRALDRCLQGFPESFDVFEI
jgi:hypothetical protein